MTRLVGDGDYRYDVVEGWGRGSTGARLGLVSSIAVDSDDRVYVFQRRPAPVMLVFDRDGTRLGSWGDDLFREPHGVWIGPDDTVFTTDTGDHTVRRFTRDGTLLQTWGTPNEPGPPGLPFNRPTWAVVGPSGDLFVSDGYGQNRCQRFGVDGALLGSWGRTGSGPGEFRLPHAIWVDRDSRVHVTDRTNNRVQIFSPTGDYLTEWSELRSPNQVFIDDDTVYIAEGDRRISVLARDGTVLARWGEAGEEPGQFRDSPHSIWADSRGDLYISEVIGEDRLQKFARRRLQGRPLPLRAQPGRRPAGPGCRSAWHDDCAPALRGTCPDVFSEVNHHGHKYCCVAPALARGLRRDPGQGRLQPRRREGR